MAAIITSALPLWHMCAAPCRPLGQGGMTPGGSGVAWDTIPPSRKDPQGTLGTGKSGNRRSCACLPVLLQRGALPDRKVTICASSRSPGPAAPGLAHLQRLHSNSISLVPPQGKVQRLSSPSWPLSPVPPKLLPCAHCFCSSGVSKPPQVPRPPHRSLLHLLPAWEHVSHHQWLLLMHAWHIGLILGMGWSNRNPWPSPSSSFLLAPSFTGLTLWPWRGGLQRERSYVFPGKLGTLRLLGNLIKYHFFRHFWMVKSLEKTLPNLSIPGKAIFPSFWSKSTETILCVFLKQYIDIENDTS